MVPFISPRVPSIGVAYARVVTARGLIALRVAKRALLLFFLSAICFSSALANPPRSNEAETFFALHTWVVAGGIATFLIQALLILWLLITRARRL